MMRWRKTVFWILLVLAVVLVLAAALALLVLRSRSFHEYVRVKIIEKAAEATGGQVEMGDYRFNWSTLHADVYRLIIRGTEKDPARPLFYAEHIGVGFKIISALRRKIDLRDIRVDHPVVHIWVDADGRSNFPHPRVPKKEGRPVDIFDLAVKNFAIAGGEVYYNDKQIPLSAELHEMGTQIQFDPTRTQYRGALDYRRGRLQVGDLRPMPHDLETQFQIAPSGAQLAHTLIATPLSRLSAHVNINDYQSPVIDGTYRAAISMQDIRYLLDDPSLPLGDVTMTGSLRYKSVPDRSFLDSLSLTGEFASSTLTVRWPEFRSDISSARGRYKLEGGDLDVSHLEAKLLGGRASGELTIRHLQRTPEFHFRGAAESLTLQALDAALRLPALRYVPLTGRVDGKGDVTWAGSLDNLKVRGDAVIKAATAARAHAGLSPIPVNGTVHLTYDNARGVLSLTQSHLRTPHTAVDLDGALGTRSRLNVRARTDDLHEVDLFLLGLRLAPAARRTAAGPPPALLGLYGSAAFDGRLEGPLKDPRVVGQATATDFQVQGSRWRSGRGAVDLSSSGVAVRQGALESATQGRIDFDLSLGLRDWDYHPSNPFAVRATVDRMSLTDLQQLARREYPVTGLVSARISVRGSELNPVGDGSVQVTEATLWGEPISNVALQFQATGDVVNVSPVTVRTSAGTASGTLVYYPKTQGYEVQASARALRIDQLQSVRARNIPVRGVLTASVQGRGTLKAPQLEATVDAPELRVQQEVLRNFKARATVLDQRADFTVDSSVTGAFIQARGTVDLKADYYATATLDTRNVLLPAILAAYYPAQARELRGELDLHAALKGPLKDPSRIEAQIDIPRFSAEYQALQIASTAPIRMIYRNDLLTIERAELKGTDTSLQFHGSIPLRGSAPMSLSAVGTVNLQLLSFFAPDLESSGQLTLDIRAQGERTEPGVQGRAEIHDGFITARTSPLGLSRLNGELLVQNDRVEIKQLRGQVGGGDVSFQGYLNYRPEVQFNFAVSGSNVRLRYPEGVRILMNSALALRGTPEAARLSGQVSITHLSFTRQFDLATFLSSFESQATPPSPNRFTQNLQLDLGVQSTEELGLVSSKLSLQGSANLRVRGTAASPVVLGRANIANGELFFMGKRYHVERGVIDFVNPVRMEPVLNVLVTTTVNQYNISMTFTGPFDRLRTNYVSDPPLPPVDIINLLAFGKVGESGAASLSAPPRLGANTILAQALAHEVSSRAEKLFGLSNLQIDPLLGGNQRNPSARLAIQQRVTKDLIFTYATDVTSTQRELIQIEYQISRRWSLTLIRDENGSVAFDARLRKTF